jgi:hypothetical protein
MKLDIVKGGDEFVVVDKNGVEYGPRAKTRKEAEEIRKDWENYYAGEKA